VRDKEEIEKQRIFMIEELWEVCRILILGSKLVQFSPDALLLGCFLNYQLQIKASYDFTHRFDEKPYAPGIYFGTFIVFPLYAPLVNTTSHITVMQTILNFTVQ